MEDHSANSASNSIGDAIQTDNTQFNADAPPLLSINEDCLRHIFKFLEFIDVVRMAETCDADAPPLLSINEDCLRHIFKFLEFIDVVRMAETCEQLSFFVHDAILPKIAEVVITDIKVEIIDENENDDFLYYFGICGMHIKELSLRVDTKLKDFSKQARFLKKIIDLSPNLEKLQANNFSFSRTDYDILKNLSTKIKHLELINCNGITDRWSDMLKKIPNLEILGVPGLNEITERFFRYSRKLTVLSVKYKTFMLLQSNDDFILHSLQYLRLEMCSEEIGENGLIKTIIFSNMPKLERLDLMDKYGASFGEFITDLPHLKSLQVLNADINLNPMFENLSKNGIIEKLSIHCYGSGTFYDESNDPALKFNELKNLEWNTCGFAPDDNVHNMLQAMIKAFMPKIDTFALCCPLVGTLTEEFITDLLALLNSKESLTAVKVDAQFQEPFTFVLNVIDILKRKTSTTRPAFELEIPKFSIGEQEMKVLKENRHLLNLL